MGEYLVFLFVAMAFVVLTESMPYFYYQHEMCAVKKLNVSELAGEWHIVYHKDDLTGKKVSTNMSLLEETSLLFSTQQDGQLVSSLNLTQHPSLPGKLENLVNYGSWTAAIPTFVLAVKPDSYITVYNSKVNGTDDWAIYSRNNTLSQEDYDKAAQGLICLNLVDTSNGKLLLHKL